MGDKPNKKHQMLIDGGATCGYREYAQLYGCIIYMTPQKTKTPWEYSITDPKNVIRFIRQRPTEVVWAVKHDPKRDSEVLDKIDNKKIYYSCNSRDMYNMHCDVSLVDTPDRVAKNAKLWFKGKPSHFWRYKADKFKKFDYLLIGRRGDKNEIYFLEQLNKVKEKREILWIGGKEFEGQVRTHHNVTYTPLIGPELVASRIPLCRVGILFTELKVEGFPQSFLEMTMAGVPVVYNEAAPRNEFYIHKDNCVLSSKKALVDNAELLLANRDSEACMMVAHNNYSIGKSYERILSCIGL